MQFMVIVKGSERSEAGELPSPEQMAEMAKLNAEMMKAGVFVTAGGLRPSKHGVRVRFDGAKRKVIDGPFSEAKELVGGFWILDVKSRDEVIDWVKKVPFSGGEEIEIRPLSTPEDFRR